MPLRINKIQKSSIFLPEDIMLCCIVTRLPVKSILRLKSVCRRWRHLISTPEFIKMHHNLKNHSLVIHVINKNGRKLSLINDIDDDSNKKKPVILDHPFNDLHVEIDIVGCINGLVCISRRQAELIALGNPALKLAKTFRPLTDLGPHEMASLGFGYAADEADFKVVRIVGGKNIANGKGTGVSRVELYSPNSDSWITMESGLQFSGFREKSNAIFNGNPCWTADQVVVMFDMNKLFFKVMPKMPHDYYEEAHVVDWDGSVGAVACRLEKKRLQTLDVWVFDENICSWRKEKTLLRPFEAKVGRFLQFWRNGRIFGRRAGEKHFVFDPQTGRVRTVEIDGSPCEVFGFTKSLECAKGMKTVEGRRKRKKLVDDVKANNDVKKARKGSTRARVPPVWHKDYVVS